MKGKVVAKQLPGNGFRGFTGSLIYPPPCTYAFSRKFYSPAKARPAKSADVVRELYQGTLILTAGRDLGGKDDAGRLFHLQPEAATHGAGEPGCEISLDGAGG